MISLDNRAGSAPLFPYLRGIGLPCQLTRLAYGDISFIGVGPGGIPITVGVEVKSINDVLQSITTGRFSGHQLPGLKKSYDIVWLLIEGLWRPNQKTGVLQYRRKRGEWADLTVGTRRFMFRDLATWLFTTEIKGGISIARVSDWGEAILWISTLYSWWTSKEWEGHRSHLALNETGRDRFFDNALLIKPTLLRMVAAELPGIGWSKSEAIANKFENVEQLVMADPDTLAEITYVDKGGTEKRIGTVVASKVYMALRQKKGMGVILGQRTKGHGLRGRV